MTAPAPSFAGRDDALDGLRGIAIALVLWHHLVEPALPLGRASPGGWLRAATGMSWSGVDLFFVLSGFLIGGILIDRRSSPRFARVFYLRRALRILPAYFVVLAVLFAAIAANWPGSYHLLPAWVYAVFATNIALAAMGSWDWGPLSVLWSLAVEEQFYLLAPWCVRLFSPRLLPWFIVSLAAAAWLGRVLVLLLLPEWQFGVRVLTPLRMDCLTYGALVAWVVRDPRGAPFLLHLRKNWRGWLAAGAAVIAALAALRPHPDASPPLAFAGYALIALFFALIVAIVVVVRPPLFRRILAAPPLTHLGRHSYFVYLWHVFLGGGLVRAFGGEDFRLHSVGGLGLLVAAFLLPWGLATVSWRWFEGPLVSWGHRHSY